MSTGARDRERSARDDDRRDGVGAGRSAVRGRGQGSARVVHGPLDVGCGRRSDPDGRALPRPMLRAARLRPREDRTPAAGRTPS